MEARPIGDVIKHARRDQRKTQEELCDGLCSTVSLSRIETGKQVPSLALAQALLQRLGLPDSRHYALLPPNELELESLIKEIQANVIHFEYASEKNKASARKQALAKLLELENFIDPDDNITRQLILRHRATLGKEDGPYSTEEELAILLKAIRLTVPSFDEKNIGKGLYSMGESLIINQIAVAYSLGGKHKNALSIYRQLFTYTKSNYQRLAQYAGRLALVTQNYARELGLIKDYEEAIKVAELGRKTCIKYGHYQFLPGHLAIMGECYYFLGDVEKSKELYIKSYSLFHEIGNEYNLAIVQSEIKNRLKIPLPF